MERFAFSLDEADKTWLEDRSDGLGVSAAELLRELIADARESDTRMNHGDTPGDTDGDTRTGESDTVVNHGDSPSDTVGEALNEHADRLDELEDRLNRLEGGGGGAIAPAPLPAGAPTADVEPSETVLDALEASGWSEGETRETRERNAGVAAWALEVLREADEELRKGGFPLEGLDDDRDTDFLWLRIARPAILAVGAETDTVAVGENKQRYRWVGE